MTAEVTSIVEGTQEVFDPKYLSLPVAEGRMHEGRIKTLQALLGKKLIDLNEQNMTLGGKGLLIKVIASHLSDECLPACLVILVGCGELKAQDGCP